MKQFSYKAIDKSGATLKGVVEALTEPAAVKVLQNRSLFVVSLQQKHAFSFKGMSISIGKSVSERDIAVFTRLLATMLSTGLPLTDALSNLAMQVKNSHFKEVIRSILHDVQSGTSLSESMGRYPDIFNQLYINLIKAGEASGKVDETLTKLADSLEASLDFKGKIKGAMIYPAIVVTAMGLIAVFMLTTVVPKIQDVYKQFNAELPLPTQILIGISELFTHYTWVVVVLGVLGFLLYRTLRKNPVSDMLMNNMFFSVPIFGALQSDVALTIMCRTLSTLLASGVGIIDSLKIVSKTMNNDYYREGLQVAAVSVEKGLPLSVAVRRNPHFPLMMSQLVAIGEETGTLDQSLDRLATFYQEASERKIKTLTTALEPLMILLMGGMVAGLAVSVLLPMFNLVNVIK